MNEAVRNKVLVILSSQDLLQAGVAFAPQSADVKQAVLVPEPLDILHIAAVGRRTVVAT